MEVLESRALLVLRLAAGPEGCPPRMHRSQPEIACDIAGATPRLGARAERENLLAPGLLNTGVCLRERDSLEGERGGLLVPRATRNQAPYTTTTTAS